MPPPTKPECAESSPAVLGYFVDHDLAGYEVPVHAPAGRSGLEKHLLDLSANCANDFYQGLAVVIIVRFI